MAAGGETRTQNWCCQLTGKLQQHFDISYYAFEKLVHPVYGRYPNCKMLNAAQLQCAPPVHTAPHITRSVAAAPLNPWCCLL